MPKKNFDAVLPESPSGDEDIGDVVAMLIDGDGNDVSKKSLNRPAVQEVVEANLPAEMKEKLENDPLAVLGANANNPALRKFLADPLQNDPLVIAAKKESSNSHLMNTVIKEIAEEAAFIKAWRNQNFDGDKDLSDATFRRIKMLEQIVKTISEKEKLNTKSGGKIDFSSKSFERVMQYFLEVIQKTFRTVKIPPQYEDIFFSKLAKEFSGFEKKAERLYYDKE